MHASALTRWRAGFFLYGIFLFLFSGFIVSSYGFLGYISYGLLRVFGFNYSIIMYIIQLSFINITYLFYFIINLKVFGSGAFFIMVTVCAKCVVWPCLADFDKPFSGVRWLLWGCTQVSSHRIPIAHTPSLRFNLRSSYCRAKLLDDDFVWWKSISFSAESDQSSAAGWLSLSLLLLTVKNIYVAKSWHVWYIGWL